MRAAVCTQSFSTARACAGGQRGRPTVQSCAHPRAGPAGAHRAAAAVGVGEQRRPAPSASAARSRPSTTWPVTPLPHGLRRAAGVARDHRQAGRRRLQQRRCPGPRRRARRRGCGRAGRTRRRRRGGRAARRPAPAPANTTCSATPRRRPAGAAARASGPSPDQQQPRSRDPRPDPRQRADQRVLALARHQPGHAGDHRRLAEAGSGGAARARAAGSGRNASVSIPGRQQLQRGVRPEGGGDPAAGVARRRW